MPSPIEIAEPLRSGAPEHALRTPLPTAIWRVLRQDYKARAEDRLRREAETGRLQRALAVTASQLSALKRNLATGRDDIATRHADAAIRTIESALLEAGIRIVAPIGEPYTGELLNLFENVAQWPDPEINVCQVKEVIEPAVLFGERLLAMGKAVVAVPQSKELNSSG